MFEEINNDEKEVHTDQNQSSEPMQNQKSPSTPEEESFKEKFFRISADFQNFKKRVEKERADWMLMAQAQLFEELLPIFDELDRALELAEKTPDQTTTAWLEGFKLIQKNWKKKLTDLGVTEINTLETFNPELHEALMQIETSDKASGEIVQILSKGYSYKSKVIKHAKVSVAK